MVSTTGNSRSSGGSTPKFRRLLVDETPFVFMTRNDAEFKLKAELARFIEKCRRKNVAREYRVFATSCTKKRLGYGRLYNAFRSTFVRNKKKMSLHQKRLERRKIAKKVIGRFVSRRHLTVRPHSWKIMDLHLYANENKRATLKRPLEPQEVIPLDVCENALIAHEMRIPIFSFNGDYEHFIALPGEASFIQYWKPEDILKQMSV